MIRGLNCMAADIALEHVQWYPTSYGLTFSASRESKSGGTLVQDSCRGQTVQMCWYAPNAAVA
jgi:hypothetical protein